MKALIRILPNRPRDPKDAMPGDVVEIDGSIFIKGEIEDRVENVVWPGRVQTVHVEYISIPCDEIRVEKED